MIMRSLVFPAALALSALAGQVSAQATPDDSCIWASDGECDEARYGGTGACQPFTDTADCSATAATAQCQYAFDFECDEARYGGGGYCADGTDTFDCALVASGVIDDSCQWANDGECDEPRYGAVPNCRDGSDTTDCQAMVSAREALFDLVPADILARLGDDSCRWAFDDECDDAQFEGTGACANGTDRTDCRAIAIGGDDSCQWANDDECDEPRIGTGACTSGTDQTDCADVIFLRNRTNACDTAFDGQCDEPGTGTGTCEARSDTADCIGRGRPANAGDHYFGRDDRFLVNTAQAPWRAIGQLGGESGFCTGTLIGPRTVLTAAHCVTEDGITVSLPDTFTVGLSRGHDNGVAQVVSAIFAPDYSPESAPPGGGNGNDWGIVTIDRPLGDSTGWLPIHVLTADEMLLVSEGGLVVAQAGYSWDTGDNLSGHVGCRITRAYSDNTILHECDTTNGDSGSPILVPVEGGYAIVAVDSQFTDAEDRNAAFHWGNLAVDSRAFAKAAAKALIEAGP
ncbi:MAG: trypsin-like serine protease [Rubellimicrobium sp.]|nr:trypsin-like serine protease [Rubellimicrobium sp.]